MNIRIKICGLTREADVDAAVEAGADALGFVFYKSSPRYVSPEHAARLIERIPPFIERVGLFVNAEPEAIEAVLAAAPLSLLQFHGDEREADCRRYQRPYLKAVRMRTDTDLMAADHAFPSASALLLDAFAEGYGGSGQTFDWSLVPADFPRRRLILSGGLNAGNVAAAIQGLRPAAVDVSSGVEVVTPNGVQKGIKDAGKIRDFIAAVRAVDSH